MNSKTYYLKKIVKNIIDNNDDAGDSFEEYSIKCALVGIDVSFDDLNFGLFLFMKSLQDKSSNPDLYDLVIDSMRRFKFIDPGKSKKLSDIIQDKLVDLVLEDKYSFEDVFEYLFKNFPDAECTKKIFHVAYGLGWIPCSISLADAVEYKNSHEI